MCGVHDTDLGEWLRGSRCSAVPLLAVGDHGAEARLASLRPRRRESAGGVDGRWWPLERGGHLGAHDALELR